MVYKIFVTSMLMRVAKWQTCIVQNGIPAM
jgi:hypothetical protein